MKDLEKEIADLKEEVAERDETIEELRSELKESDEKINELQEEINDLEEKVEALESEADLYEESFAADERLNATQPIYFKTTGNLIDEQLMDSIADALDYCSPMQIIEHLKKLNRVTESTSVRRNRF